MTQTSSFFSDFGIDPLRGGELMKYLGLTTDHFSDPRVASRFQHIAKFMGKHEDGFRVLRMAMAKHVSPHVDPLDHLESLVLLHERRQEIHEKLPEIKTPGEHTVLIQELQVVEKEIGMYE